MQRAAAAGTVGHSSERDATEGKHHTATGGRTQSWQPIMYKVQFHLTKTIYFLCKTMRCRRCCDQNTQKQLSLLQTRKATDP